MVSQLLVVLILSIFFEGDKTFFHCLHREVEEKCTPRQMKELLMKYERTKHFMIWADNSTIMNHGHIMYLVQCLYDPAFFFTPEEMKARGHENLDVPSIIERPHLYILGRCGSKEIEQLAYVDTR